MQRRHAAALPHQVTRTLQYYQMLVPGDRVLVALSGGPDSVALLAVLHALSAPAGIEVRAAHFNHQLRGEESWRDQRCAEAVARDLGVACMVGMSDSAASAGNLEARMRDARYAFLSRVADGHGCTRIATGHTLDDQAETVLMRVLRGTGWDGLAGIRPVRDGRIIRPLIECSRDQVLAFLRTVNLPFCDDSSNADRRFLRNRLRHEILPRLQAISPDVRRNLASLAAIANEEGAWLEERVRAVLETARVGDGGLAVHPLNAAPMALRPRLLRLWLREQRGDLRRVAAAHYRAIIDLALGSRPNGQVHLPGAQRVIREYDQLRWVQHEVPAAIERGQVLVPGSAVTLNSGWRISAALPGDAAGLQPPDLWQAVVDAKSIGAPLVVRTPRPGDRMRPLGLGGHRKLQDLFVDRKLPVRARREYPVVVCADEILWVPGVARGDWALVHPTTRSRLRLVAERTGTGIAGP